jgi:hypothetical protein
MPYYLYRVKPFTQLDQLCNLETFAQASAQAKLLRQQLDANSPDKIKVIFASDPFEAEELLCQVRVAGPRGDE